MKLRHIIFIVAIAAVPAFVVYASPKAKPCVIECQHGTAFTIENIDGVMHVGCR